MENPFTEAMSQRSDKQLAEIITIHHVDYQPEAIEAARLEFQKRNLDTSSFVTEADIQKTEEVRKPIDPSKEDLHWYFKILTFGMPSLVWVICGNIFIDSPPLVYLFIPITIGIQYSIHHLLLEKKLNKIAKDFKNWSYYAWFIRSGFFLIGYILALMGD